MIVKKLLFYIFALTGLVCSELGERIKRYDLFHHDHVRHHISKRDVYTKFPDTRRLEFNSLGKNFKLELKKETSLFTSDFRVTIINGQGSKKTVDILPNLYHGHVQGDPTSKVEAMFHRDDLFTGKVKINNESFVFEPSWRHIPHDTNSTMIGYKENDVNYKFDLGDRFCESAKLPLMNDNKVEDDDDDEDDDNDDDDQANNNNSSDVYNDNDDVDDENDGDDDDDDDRTKKNGNINNGNDVNNYNQKHQRTKRETSSTCTKDNKVCTLMLVAEYNFFKNMGNGDVEATTGYMISVIDQVNQIYSRTAFGGCGTGFQFEIREIVVHDSYSDDSDPKYEYNMDKFINTSNLLEFFSRNPHNKNFCLAHLFTYRSFDTGVLGLAYIGSSRRNTKGGVGTTDHYIRNQQFYINTGWSSSLNKYNRKLLTVEAYLVTAHELGHNWGSDHDMDTDECSPSKHGKYIMYMFSVSGREDNNKNFSPCSRRSMGNLIREKAGYYFSKKSGSFCGNYKVEEGEECDEGPDASDAGGGGESGSRGHRCCSKCKLTSMSQCSDLNQECCQNCKFAPATTSCFGEQDFGCKTSSKCSGKDTTCLPAGNKPDGTDCIANGKCRNGRCQSLCEYNKKHPCICSTLSDACKWCCQTSDSDGTCTPFNNSFILPAGTPCVQGFCDKKGVCVKQEVQNTIQRLWRIIENIDANQLVLFMRANIVGTVIILSLIVWIPASCVVAYVDRKRARREKEEFQWYSPENDKLVLPAEEERFKIRRGAEVRSSKLRASPL